MSIRIILFTEHGGEEGTAGRLQRGAVIEEDLREQQGGRGCQAQEGD